MGDMLKLALFIDQPIVIYIMFFFLRFDLITLPNKKMHLGKGRYFFLVLLEAHCSYCRLRLYLGVGWLDHGYAKRLNLWWSKSILCDAFCLQWFSCALICKLTIARSLESTLLGLPKWGQAYLQTCLKSLLGAYLGMQNQSFLLLCSFFILYFDNHCHQICWISTLVREGDKSRMV